MKIVGNLVKKVMETVKNNTSKFDQLIENADFNRFGLICVILTVVGCLGGITVGLGAIENTFMLSTVVMTTMITLSLLISVSPMKWIMYSTIATLVIDFILIAILLLS